MPGRNKNKKNKKSKGSRGSGAKKLGAVLAPDLQAALEAPTIKDVSIDPATAANNNVATLALRNALRECSLDQLRNTYQTCQWFNHKTFVDEARHDMEEELMQALSEGIHQLSPVYQNVLSMELKKMGGMKITYVKDKGQSFAYTCGFTGAGGKEMLAQNTHTDWNVGAIFNYHFKCLKKGGPGPPLAPGHTVSGPRGIVYLLKEPSEELLDTLLIKATKTLEPTRFYGLMGYELLLLAPIGIPTNLEPTRQATRDEAKKLSNGFNVPGYRSLNAACAWCKKKEAEDLQPLSLCTGCRRVRYCSRECQAKHWKDGHKSACMPLPDSIVEQFQNMPRGMGAIAQYLLGKELHNSKKE